MKSLIAQANYAVEHNTDIAQIEILRGYITEQCDSLQSLLDSMDVETWTGVMREAAEDVLLGREVVVRITSYVEARRSRDRGG